MTEKTQAYEIERPEPVILPPTKIPVPLNDEVIRFTHPFTGQNTYRNAGTQILERNQILPTGEQTAAFLEAAYLGPEEFRQQGEIKELRDSVMAQNYLWVFNRNLWTPEDSPRGQGVYVQHDSRALGLSEKLDIEDLERLLHGGDTIQRVTFSKDRKTAFAPRNTYKLGEHTEKSFANDGFVIASFQPQGSEKLGLVSKEFKNQPRTWGLDIDKGQKAVQRVSAVDDYDGRLFLGGFYDGSGGLGYASGVFN